MRWNTAGNPNFALNWVTILQARELRHKVEKIVMDYSGVWREIPPGVTKKRGEKWFSVHWSVSQYIRFSLIALKFFKNSENDWFSDGLKVRFIETGDGDNKRLWLMMKTVNPLTTYRSRSRDRFKTIKSSVRP